MVDISATSRENGAPIAYLKACNVKCFRPSGTRTFVTLAFSSGEGLAQDNIDLVGFLPRFGGNGDGNLEGFKFGKGIVVSQMVIDSIDKLGYVAASGTDESKIGRRDRRKLGFQE
jgi:hypothetical protein